MADETKKYLDKAGVEIIKAYINQEDNKVAASLAAEVKRSTEADAQHTSDISANSSAIGVNASNIALNTAAIAAEEERATGVETQLGTDIANALVEAKGYTDTEVGKEKARAEVAEAAALKAGQDAQKDVDNLETYVGTIPTGYTEANIVAFINKKAEETLSAAQGGSSETAASVKAALDTHKSENEASFKTVNDNIAEITKDYLKEEDKTELTNAITTAKQEAIDAVLDGVTDDFDTLKEVAAWIQNDTTNSTQLINRVSGLEGKVDIEGTVSAAISSAISAENLGQYAKTADISATLAKVDTTKNVSEAISDAITGLKGENLWDANGAAATAISNLKAENLWDTNGSAAAAEASAKAYADGLAVNYDAAGAAATAEENAKAYTDAEIAKFVALTENELKAIFPLDKTPETEE